MVNHGSFAPARSLVWAVVVAALTGCPPDGGSDGGSDAATPDASSHDGGPMMDATVPPGDAGLCPPGRTICGGVCVDPAGDGSNCGTCGNVCPSGLICTGGSCQCPSGGTVCGGVCVNTGSDPNHCGGCGTVCPTGICFGGACLARCPTGLSQCGVACIDLATNPDHCGTCTATCTTPQVCVAGACASSCAPGTTVCGRVCSDFTSDPINCGSCGHPCATGQVCTGSTCMSCAGGTTNCDGTCVSLATDAANCGTCENVCTVGYACVSGTCTCAAPNTLCGSTCTDLGSDPNHCGACGTVCSGGDRCVGGACAPQTFEMTSFGITGCVELSVNSIIGVGIKGLAVSPTRVFVSGPSATLEANTDPSSPAPISALYPNAMVSDLQSGTVYLMMDAAGNMPPSTDSLAVSYTLAQLAVIDGTTGALTSTRVALSSPIVLPAGTAAVGFFSGYGHLLIHTGTATGARWYRISLPSGAVTPLNVASVPSPMPTSCIWAYWGIAEYHDGADYVLYPVEDGIGFVVDRLVRYRISDGTNTDAVMFPGIGLVNTCAISFSPVTNRWYFAHEAGNDAFTPTGTSVAGVLGSCPGTFSTP